MTCMVSAKAENGAVYAIEVEETTDGIAGIARATDKIEIKYRVYKGVVQYRRWNATKNRWVDPEWKNL